MATEWQSAGFPGVRFKKHPTRKHGVQFDKYFAIYYQLTGKRKEEGVGWASDGFKASDAYDMLKEIRNNQKTGQGPVTLAEKRELAEAEKEAERKQQATVVQQTFKAFFDDIYLPDAKTRWKPQTAEKAKQHVKNWIHPVTGETPFRELNLTHVNRIKANLSEAGRSARQQQYVFRTFSMVWNAAIDHGLVEIPCPTKSSSFRLPKVDNERQRYLTPEEEKLLLEKAKTRSEQAYQMALVSLDAGLRFGEIASLTWGCVDLEIGILRVLDTKSGTDRLLPMTERLKTMFKGMDRGNPGGLVFPGKDGQIHTEAHSSFRAAVNDAKLNQGVTNRKMRASFHTLRHTFASRLVQAGVDLYRVQRLLGHSTPVMTARYSKLADTDLREAVQAMEQNGKIRKGKGKVVPLRARR
ncbi:MAG: tyrosine-type recombinase/integrase [Desulfobacterales bacterium]